MTTGTSGDGGRAAPAAPGRMQLHDVVQQALIPAALQSLPASSASSASSNSGSARRRAAAPEAQQQVVESTIKEQVTSYTPDRSPGSRRKRTRGSSPHDGSSYVVVPRDGTPQSIQQYNLRAEHHVHHHSVHVPAVVAQLEARQAECNANAYVNAAQRAESHAYADAAHVEEKANATVVETEERARAAVEATARLPQNHAQGAIDAVSSEAGEQIAAATGRVQREARLQHRRRPLKERLPRKNVYMLKRRLKSPPRVRQLRKRLPQPNVRSKKHRQSSTPITMQPRERPPRRTRSGSKQWVLLLLLTQRRRKPPQRQRKPGHNPTSCWPRPIRNAVGLNKKQPRQKGQVARGT